VLNRNRPRSVPPAGLCVGFRPGTCRAVLLPASLMVNCTVDTNKLESYEGRHCRHRIRRSGQFWQTP
jgi:hypothetical protein